MTVEVAGTRLQGLRVLVVEDEATIAMLMEDMLLDLGSEIVGPASRLGQALALAESEPIDLAILDVNVAGEPVYPVINVLDRRGISFIFSTGYGSAGIEGEWQSRPVLQKPFSQAELEKALGTALGRPAEG